MQALIKFMLLAPALSAFAAPHQRHEKEVGDGSPIFDHSFALVALELKGASHSYDKHLQSQAISLRLDVFPSEAACGHANVTIDGQTLPISTDGAVMNGRGSLLTERNSILAASWTFQCIKVNGQPDSLFLKFVVNSVDGRDLEGAGFSTLFRQTGGTEIIRINNDLSVSDRFAANPDAGRLQLLEEQESHPHHEHGTNHGIDHELAELDWLMAQLHELKYLIAEKKLSIARHATTHYVEDLKHCDSLKCIIKAMAKKAKHTVYTVYDKIAGDDQDRRFHDHHGGKHLAGKKFGNQIPKADNGTHSGRRNHTGPPSHGGKHHKFLPICRLPPHHGEHHHHKLHHGLENQEISHRGRHGENGRGVPHHDHHHHGANDAESSSDRHHGEIDRDFAHHDHQSQSHAPNRHESHHPDQLGPHHEDFTHPPHHRHEEEIDHGAREDDFHHEGFSGEHGDDLRDEQEPLFDEQGEDNHFGTLENGPRSHHNDDFHSHGPPNGPPHSPPPHETGPPPFASNHGKHHGPPHIIKALFFLKFGIVGFLASIFGVALYCRACSPSKKADRKARRERRRAYRRTIHKNAIMKLLARISGNNSDDEDESDEKVEGEGSSTVAGEITQLVNAVEIVDEIVSAEEGRSNSIPIEPRRDFHLSSDIEDEDELLPAYEDSDGSEMGSMIVDGFQYTPGSSNYSPNQSGAGSASDILGPDTKA